MIRYAVVSIVSAYLGAGLFAGLLLQRGVPALNTLGVVVVALTWPDQLRCARVESDCEPISSKAGPYIFSFSRDEPDA